MANQNSVEIVFNWALIFHPIIHTSVVEEVWSIARLESTRIPKLLSKRFQIDPLMFQIHYANVVDLVVVIILSFESLISMHYCVRYGRLKFWWWNLFCSIHLMCDVICLAMPWSLISIECAMCWCAHFWVLVKMFLSVNEHSLFMDACVKKTKFRLLRTLLMRFAMPNPLPIVYLGLARAWLHEELHARIWLARARVWLRFTFQNLN